jgi:hypothetical protein
MSRQHYVVDASSLRFLQNPLWHGRPPTKHGQDARAPLAVDGFCKRLRIVKHIRDMRGADCRGYYGLTMSPAFSASARWRRSKEKRWVVRDTTRAGNSCPRRRSSVAPPILEQGGGLPVRGGGVRVLSTHTRNEVGHLDPAGFRGYEMSTAISRAPGLPSATGCVPVWRHVGSPLDGVPEPRRPSTSEGPTKERLIGAGSARVLNRR